MAFLFFERMPGVGASILRNSGERYQLAGSGLLQQAWQQQGRKIEPIKGGSDPIAVYHPAGLP
jgi:hypothetical protein